MGGPTQAVECTVVVWVVWVWVCESACAVGLQLLQSCGMENTVLRREVPCIAFQSLHLPSLLSIGGPLPRAALQSIWSGGVQVKVGGVAEC